MNCELAYTFVFFSGGGPGTVNHYVRAVRGFFRWMLKLERLGSDPLEALLADERAGGRPRSLPERVDSRGVRGGAGSGFYLRVN